MGPDLVVIGGGYWGVAAAVVARRRGLEVLHVDARHADGASRAASAHFAFGWYKGAWAARVRAAYDTAELLGVTFDWRGARVNSPADRKRGDFRGGRIREDWAIFEVGAFLCLSEPVTRAVVAVDRDGLVTFYPNGVVRPRLGTIVAAGAWTDELLVRSGLRPLGVTGLRGTGVVLRAPEPEPGRVFVHAINPFKSIAIRPWGPGELRAGETSEPHSTVGPSPPKVSQMVERIRHLELGEPVRTISGVRPMLKSGPRVERVAPKVVAATGGGRIGAVLGFWAAEEALCQLNA